MSLETLEKRLQYIGGINAEKRMQKGKLNSLKKALLYSYQAATAILQDGREFRCLINPDRLKNDYDDKIISIPFEDICLGIVEEQINEETGEIIKIEKPITPKDKTSKGIEPIGMKAGDVFTWKETNSSWIVYLQRLEEDAYFRAEIRKCDYEVEINGKKYKVYAKGPDKDSILWHTKKNISWSDVDYEVLLYITKNEETEKFFHRFMKIKLNGKPWEVQVVDNISTEGILEVALKETYQNTIEEERLSEIEDESYEYVNILKVNNYNSTTDTAIISKDNIVNNSLKIIAEKHEIEENFLIKGDTKVYPYDKKTYSINASGGTWVLSNKKAVITSYTDNTVDIEIITGRSGEVQLIYKQEDEEDIVLNITIQSL